MIQPPSAPMPPGIPGQGMPGINPMLQFNKSGPGPAGNAQAMQQLLMLLGGIGRGPAAMPLAPGMSQQQPEPMPNQLQTILGGLSAGLPG